MSRTTTVLRAFFPESIRQKLRRAIAATVDWNIAPSADFYSPLPKMKSLLEHERRWFRASDMAGVEVDLKQMEEFLTKLVAEYSADYQALPPYDETKQKGFGPGFTTIDAMVLYFMVRHLRPRRFIEIGSGLSSYYAWLAGQKNRTTNQPLRQLCIDPMPFQSLGTLPDIEIRAQEAQDADLAWFSELEAGDILFIDSTHVVKVDGEVPYLVLEVLPRLKPGVMVHFHDIHFPYHVPCDAQQYVYDHAYYWTEAMLVQAFLCFNKAFRIVLSTPMLRFHAESFLQKTLPGYQRLNPKDWDTHHGSLWIQRVS